MTWVLLRTTDDVDGAARDAAGPGIARYRQLLDRLDDAELTLVGRSRRTRVEPTQHLELFARS